MVGAQDKRWLDAISSGGAARLLPTASLPKRTIHPIGDEGGPAVVSLLVSLTGRPRMASSYRRYSAITNISNLNWGVRHLGRPPAASPPAPVDCS